MGQIWNDAGHLNAVGEGTPALLQITAFQDSESFACCHVEHFARLRGNGVQSQAAATAVGQCDVVCAQPCMQSGPAIQVGHRSF